MSKIVFTPQYTLDCVKEIMDMGQTLKSAIISGEYCLSEMGYDRLSEDGDYTIENYNEMIKFIKSLIN